MSSKGGFSALQSATSDISTSGRIVARSAGVFTVGAGVFTVVSKMAQEIRRVDDPIVSSFFIRECAHACAHTCIRVLYMLCMHACMRACMFVCMCIAQLYAKLTPPASESSFRFLCNRFSLGSLN